MKTAHDVMMEELDDLDILGFSRVEKIHLLKQKWGCAHDEAQKLIRDFEDRKRVRRTVRVARVSSYGHDRWWYAGR
jgi:hypothetical protein